jgi:hypothetical protein
MSAQGVETLLARLYREPGLREEFAARPLEVAIRAGLTEEEAREMARVDLGDLELAAESYGHKRDSRKRLPP